MSTILHGVDDPEDEGVCGNGLEEVASLGVFGHSGGTSVNGELIDDDQQRSAGHGVVCPLHPFVRSKGRKETGQDHDDIGHDGDQDVSTAQAGEETKIHEQKRCGNSPVDVSSPVDLTINDLVGVRDMLVGLLDDDLDHADAVTRRHCKIRDSCEGGDEGSQDMEQTFLLGPSQHQFARLKVREASLPLGHGKPWRRRQAKRRAWPRR